jgi:hypothetical protein
LQKDRRMGTRKETAVIILPRIETLVERRLPIEQKAIGLFVFPVLLIYD